MMRKLILIFAMVAALIFALPVAAAETEAYTDVDSTVESTEYTTADTVIEDTTVAETTAAETTIVETTIGETEAATSTEALIEIDKDSSFSEVVLAIADKFGISIEEAEKMVGNIRELGDKYLSDSDLWDEITADMDANPARWTVIGLMAVLIIFLIGLLIKRVISDATTLSRLKMSVTDIRRGLLGDEEGEQDNVSICTLIKEKNMQIEQLKIDNASLIEIVEELKIDNAALMEIVEELKIDNAALMEIVEELKKSIEVLNDTIHKMESNSDTSLKITEESALQILQLLNLALDRKVPVTTKEARALWYSATQNKIKSIYEEGVTNAENVDQRGKTGQAGQAGEKV